MRDINGLEAGKVKSVLVPLSATRLSEQQNTKFRRNECLNNCHEDLVLR